MPPLNSLNTQQNMEKKQKARNHAFDILCGICIVRMVTLHIMTLTGQRDQVWWQEVMQWTYYFMSFFFFKAGYFCRSVGGRNRAYLIDRSQRLLAPYLSSAFIGLLVYFSFYYPLKNKYGHFVEEISWSQLYKTSGVYGNTPIWFLFSFFCMYVVAHFTEKVRYLRWVWALGPLMSWWLWTQGNPLYMSVNNVFMGLFFFYLGHLWHWAMEKFGDRRMLLFSAVLVVAAAVGNVLLPGQYAMSSNTFTGHSLMAVVNATLALCGLSGILLATHVRRVPWLCYIGEHSMVYFLLHYPMLYFYKFTHLCFGRGIYRHPDDAIILIPVIFCICSWLVPYVEQLPWLSGRWGKPNPARVAAASAPQPSAEPAREKMPAQDEAVPNK